jgi:2-keto-4-pentenoate hydratase/2-oxohepta-3-ene-1,7-dioic acid hydratase in catechol pathway
MKLMSFWRHDRATFGMVVADRVLDLGDGGSFPDLKSFLAGGDAARRTAERARHSADEADWIPLDACAFLPVIPSPDKIICVGLNYEEHRVETGRAKTENPVLFVRFADSQTGHGEPAWIPRPETSTKVDYEGELAVIIGAPPNGAAPEDDRAGARYIDTDRALAFVAGYACYNDISVRDWQRHTSQFTAGKNFPRTGAFGPWMVTADEIKDPHSLDLVTRLNGETMQKARTDQMIFKVADLISYCSRFTALRPGDVISTGTPGGVGFTRNPPVYLKDGDTVEVEISGIGVLRNRVSTDPA